MNNQSAIVGIHMENLNRPEADDSMHFLTDQEVRAAQLHERFLTCSCARELDTDMILWPVCQMRRETGGLQELKRLEAATRSIKPLKEVR